MDLLTRQVQFSDEYVLLFDESLIHELNQKQMDVCVNFGDDREVTTHYLTSHFLGHATADHLYAELFCCDAMGKTGIIQLSMDGLNVN